MEIFGIYFNGILIGSTIVALIGIILLGIGIFRDSDYTLPGVIIIILAGIFGFGVIASLAPVRTEQYQIEEFEIAFTTSTVTLSFDNYAEIFYDAKTYNILKDRENCQVYYSIKFNSYGYEIETPQLVIDKRYE